MLFVSALGGGQRQQNVALFPGAPLREIAVHSRLGAFVGQMPAPAAQIRRTRESSTPAQCAPVLTCGEKIPLLVIIGSFS